MNKTELITAVAMKAGHSKLDSGKIVNAFFDVIGDALAYGENVQLIGFGTFGITDAKARNILHPETGHPIHLAAGKRPKFTAGTKLKAAANKYK